MSILITNTVWEQIRSAFDETEKEQLREALCGQSICPAGWSVDETKLAPELAKKLSDRKGVIVNRGKARR